MGEAPETVHVDGKVAHRDFMAEQTGQRSGGAGWPLECFASGVNANQADDLRAYFKKHNFDCEVTERGNPNYKNHQHRKRALKLRGFCDRASFGT